MSQRVAWVCAVGLALAACDVVERGGASVQIVKAPERARAEPAAEAVEAAPAREPIRLPAAPVLFRVWRVGDGRARAEPIAALGDTLEGIAPDAAERWVEYSSAFAARHYPPGSELALHREGIRVGTFRVDSARRDSVGSCPSLRADGRVELTPAALGTQEYLATGERVARVAPPREDYRPLDLRPETRELAVVLADRALQERGWGEVWRPRQAQDLRPVRRLGEGPPGFAATFLKDDSLTVAPPGPQAASLFLVADYDRAVGYVPAFLELQRYAEGDKRAPRWVDRFDTDGDGRLEWVVLAFGVRTRWYEVYRGADGRFRRVWSGRIPLCEVAASP